MDNLGKHDKRLSTRQLRFLKEYLRGCSATEAAWRTYNCSTRRSAAEIGSKTLRLPAVRVALERMIQKVGLDEYTIAMSLKDIIKQTGA